MKNLMKYGREKIASWRLGDYFRQLSVVIIGILVTFTGSDLVGRYARSREARTAMRLVVSELEVNRAKLQHVCERLEQDQNGMRMFAKYQFNVDSISEDSLAFYNIIGSMRDFSVRTDALDVLKSSGVSSSIGDKQLLLDVLGCYNRMESFSKTVRAYNERKKDALDHLFVNMKVEKMNRLFSEGSRHSWKTMLDDPLCRSFVGFSISFFGDETFFDERLTDVDQTIATITKNYEFE